MTFEDALKRLSEKEPEKFRITDLQDISLAVMKMEVPGENNVFDERFFEWGERGATLPLPLDDFSVTQDDIDEILALIGWVYQVQWHKLDIWGQKNEWDWTIANKDDCDWDDKRYPDKLSAAKAALIAVVEKEYP